MRLDSRATIHAGVNFVLAPFPGLDRTSCLKIQETLSDLGVNLSNVVYGEREFVAARQRPAPLEIKIGIVGPQIGQLLILATQSISSLDIFYAEADDIVKAFDETWPFPQRQIVSCDATIRDLYETSSEHSFAELWEKRLHQTPHSLQIFGRGVLGGGLRFVMAPKDNNPVEPLIEVKIESYLSDTRKLFLESQFTWQQPLPVGTPLDPSTRLEQVNEFIQKEVVKFIQEGQP
jgi:hypothetical protein